MKVPLGAAVLIGAILAPTDPVPATEVQVRGTEDRDQIRINLTGEAALNDGTAFPFVMLGLGLLGLHEVGEYFQRFILVDLLWSSLGGIILGSAIGFIVGTGVLHLRRSRDMVTGYDEFVALGLLSVTYGLALLISTYGFLAIFFAAYVFGRLANKNDQLEPMPDQPPNSKRAGHADGGRLATNARSFNEQLERIAELMLVFFIGALLWTLDFEAEMFVLAVVGLFIVRPVAVWIGLTGCKLSLIQKSMTAWFGVRGIGSIFYLCFAVQNDLPAELTSRIAALALITIALSVVLHGISATPLMDAYQKRRLGR
ncbi:MAG: cation:proton antiporter [Proteobacteria bacterium]|nr:cation:proton antiporter [Pseudomonadota bacterium]